MIKKKWKGKILATTLGLSMLAACMVVPIEIKATEIDNVTVSENEVEANVVEVDEVEIDVQEQETEEAELTTEATVAEIKNSPVLALNVARKGDKLATSTEEKWYQFTVTDSGYFSIDFKLNDAANPDDVNNGWDMYIYRGLDDLNSPIKTLEDIKSNTASPILSMGKGTYYVKICACNTYYLWAPTNVPYDMTVKFVAGSEWEQEYNDSNVTANKINVNKIYKGGLYLGGDVDWYQFDITKNGYFEVQFGMNDLTDVNKVNYGWNVEIYDSKLNCIRKYEDIKGKKIQSTLDSDKLPYKAGTYYIKVYARNSYYLWAPVDCYYDLKVNYTATDSWESEYNDSNTTADALKSGIDKLGLLYDSTDQDWYSINVPKRGKISINFLLDSTVKEGSINYGWNVTLFDSGLNEVKSFQQVTSNMSYLTDTLNPGIYYVKVNARNTYYAYSPTGCIYHVKATFAEANQRSEIEDFVGRMYTVALDRDAEAAGLKSWSDQLQNGKIDGAGIAQGFIGSEEFTNRRLSNSKYIDTLYRTFFNREPDTNGKNNWLTKLNKKTSRMEVLAGFVNSQEFANLCDQFHIARGTMQADGSSVYRAGVRNYVLRMYTKALNRNGETVGVEDWTNRINTKQMSAEDVAKSFFSSEEFINRNLSNEDYVETLYQTFMDRPSDAGGKADWVNKLNSGVSRQTVLEGFSRSEEFGKIMRSYGL